MPTHLEHSDCYDEHRRVQGEWPGRSDTLVKENAVNYWRMRMRKKEGGEDMFPQCLSEASVLDLTSSEVAKIQRSLREGREVPRSALSRTSSLGESYARSLSTVDPSPDSNRTGARGLSASQRLNRSRGGRSRLGTPCPPIRQITPLISSECEVPAGLFAPGPLPRE
jgi:hypothetical protein